MSHEQVVQSEAGGVGGWALVIGIAVVAALFSMLSQPPRNTASPPPVAPPSAAPATTPPAHEPSAAPPISLGPTAAALELTTGYVSAREICHVSTDHRTTLAISLVLHNDTAVTEHVEQLSPALPLAGLVDKGAVIRSGGCTTPFGNPARAAGQVLPADTTMLVTLHLGLPKTCPQPLPVGLDVTLSIGGNVRAERLPLFNDLGSVRFASCPVS